MKLFSGKGRLIMVSNRLPLSITRVKGGYSIEQSTGGVATGLLAPHRTYNGIWMGWTGSTDEGVLNDPEVRRKLKESRIAPVALSPAELDAFYGDISNAVLWPIFHDRLDRLPLVIRGWDSYEAVNTRFADCVAEIWKPGDLVWVHDYQLARVPALLRERIPEARIGFFLHIPFPNSDIFSAFPARRAIIEGMLGADLVGFHTNRYRHHFMEAARSLLGLTGTGDDSLPSPGRTVGVGVFPMGVDAAAIATHAGTREVAQRTMELKAGKLRLLVGIDRLDYSKGIPRRLLAFEQLLIRHPEWRGHIRLVQVAVPSRDGVDAYKRFRRELEALVTRVNGEFATPAWTPVHYLHREIPLEMLLALYRAADIMLVTPVRDGMNLVAKEFLASRSDEDGVLVLSEFAGAAAELPDALLVNPYDVVGTADVIHAALNTPGPARRQRMRRLRQQVMENDIYHWADSFLGALSPPED